MSRMSRGRSIIRPSMRANIPPRRGRGALFGARHAAGEDGARELVRDGVHVHLFPAAAVHQDRVAAATGRLEPGALVGADPARVPGHDLEQHVAQAQVVERPVEREPGRLGAEALAAALAEEDPEAGAAVVVVDVHEPARAERLAVAAVVDRERRSLRVVGGVALEHVVDPRLLGPLVEDAEVREPDAHVGPVQPARVRGGEVAAQRPERDALALDQVLGAAHRSAPLGTYGRSGPSSPPVKNGPSGESARPASRHARTAQSWPAVRKSTLTDAPGGVAASAAFSARVAAGSSRPARRLTLSLRTSANARSSHSRSRAPGSWTATSRSTPCPAPRTARPIASATGMPSAPASTAASSAGRRARSTMPAAATQGRSSSPSRA